MDESIAARGADHRDRISGTITVKENQVMNIVTVVTIMLNLAAGLIACEVLLVYLMRTNFVECVNSVTDNNFV
ncbi:hypothetical protein SAMN02745166_02015 [Prosthecobacter debontii]|uniref:Uncharacterized protein n=1 Tax=Prosthecobacter debontii TaxID=48467 RepID=A0A1T4XUY1_9BACT|nr:hypothetical protein SAMN02745166_02015 [Prosthecobacter debontii]